MWKSIKTYNFNKLFKKKDCAGKITQAYLSCTSKKNENIIFFLIKREKESYNFSYCMVLVGQQLNLLPNQRIININTILKEDDLFYGQYLPN